MYPDRAVVEDEDLVQAELAQPEEAAEPEAHMQDPIQAKQAAVDLTTSPDTEFDRDEDMVTRKTMTIDRFMPGARQTA